MKYDKHKIYKLFTFEDVRKLIGRLYSKSDTKRKLLIHKSNCNYDEAGCLFFALDGSPPKGYGLYVPDHCYLLIIDAFGKTKRYDNCKLVNENDEWIDIEKLNNFIELKEEYQKLSVIPEKVISSAKKHNATYQYVKDIHNDFLQDK